MPAEAASSAILPDDLRESQQGMTTDTITSSDASLESLGRFAASSAIGVNLYGLKQQGKDMSGPKCLLPEALRRAEGVGPITSLDEYSAKLLVVTLDITDVVERTGLTVSIWGSPDSVEWGTKPLLTFRQRQYCGVYSVLLNLATRHDIRYLRVHWSMSRWGKTNRVPVFGFEVFVEESGARVSSSALA